MGRAVGGVMGVETLPDGRIRVYWREYVLQEDGTRKSKTRKEYFGRGPQAKARADEFNASLGLQRTRRPQARSSIKFEELADHYRHQKKMAKEMSPNSLRHLSIRLDTNILPALGNLPATRVDYKALDAYVERRRTNGVKNSTIRRELNDIKAILGVAASGHPPIIAFNPARDYKAPKSDDAVILPPSQEELEALLAAAVPHLKRFIILCVYMGARPGGQEVLRLTWSDVVWEAATIQVHAAAKGNVKNLNPVRMVPLAGPLMEHLRTWWAEDQKIFKKASIRPPWPIIHYARRPVGKIQKSWKRAREKAGITRRLRPYDLRHLFVTRALENGADIGALAEVVGSRPETLRKHYQHVSRQLRRATVDLAASGILGGSQSDGVQETPQRPKHRNGVQNTPQKRRVRNRKLLKFRQDRTGRI